MQYIMTYFPEYGKQALREALRADEKLKSKKLAAHISLLDTEMAGAAFIHRLLTSKPVFIRHIMPANAEGLLTNDTEQDLPRILDAVTTVCTLGEGAPFAVQARILDGEMDYSAKDVEVYIGQYYDRLGATPYFSDRALLGEATEALSVISLLLYRDKFYAGVSPAAHNLSAHSDEYRLLSRAGRDISRAENKLKEAIAAFHIQVTGSGWALDIGASPGGWTKVLADYGFHVVAVDPGDLHPALRDHPRIRHHKTRIETLCFEEKFSIIVNDMNVDPQITAGIMVNLSERLADGGLAVVTLKLPFADVDRSIAEATEILQSRYELLALRSLSHNRREVTALLRVR